MADTDFVQELRERKELLELFAREMIELFRIMNKTIAEEFQATLSGLLSNEFQQFRGTLLQSLAAQGPGAAPVETGVATALAQAQERGVFRLSAGQTGADLLDALRKSQRNV